MDVQTRIRTIRLMEQLSRHPQWARALGMEQQMVRIRETERKKG